MSANANGKKVDANDIAREKGPAGLAEVLDQKTEEAPAASSQPAPLDGLLSPAPDTTPSFLSAGALMVKYTELRPAVIHGLLREGEILNVIAPSKGGKSHMALDIAIAIAAGEPWLDFECEQGEVLLLDNELHPETIAYRMPLILERRGIAPERIADTLQVETLRGRLLDIVTMEPYVNQLTPGRFKLVIFDSLYRFLPPHTDENSNADMARIYNYFDAYAKYLLAALLLVHHPSKGSQAGKAVTDVGAGAGAMSRATDSHLILRSHREPNAVVMEAVTRSFIQPQARCLRWAYPVWNLAPDLDPADLADPYKHPKKTPASPAAPAPAPWTAKRFASEFVTETPEVEAAIIDRAMQLGKLGKGRAEALFKQGKGADLIFQWDFGVTKPRKYATIPQDRTQSLESESQ